MYEVFLVVCFILVQPPPPQITLFLHKMICVSLLNFVIISLTATYLSFTPLGQLHMLMHKGVVCGFWVRDLECVSNA